MTNATTRSDPPASSATTADLTPSQVVGRLRSSYDAGVTRSMEWRRAQLRAFLRLLDEGERELVRALGQDMGKPPIEAWTTEIGFVASEIAVMLRNLDRWARPERVRLPLVQRPGRAQIVREPLGVTLVIAPWNYPVHLLLLPMASAVAAGNAVIGKPSEITPATSAALSALAVRFLDPDAVAVVEGGVEETQELLGERFDHIFYTGNGRVATKIMEAAAQHLTPVTLELGGKSPAIVTADADVEVAARRIAWGKFLNAGQTCVAPDYVLVTPETRAPLLTALQHAVRGFFGTDPKASRDYARIVNAHHTRRLAALLDASRDQVVFGGQVDEDARYIAPTVLDDVPADAPMMREEIFGPLLPVLEVASVEAAIEFVNARPKPLALYVFCGDSAAADHVIGATSSGGVCVNHTMMQLGVPDLPFGGVGMSGMGSYHGRHGFDTFSHRRSVLVKTRWPDPPVAYPPYTQLKSWILRRAVGR
ncbi:MAG TPA: aldehyde dehydrogenase family protein [Acidimicrobiales bacterium]|nr:aldehyde dehydrogenase family protein [Acidimicrobiales bacterium]